MGSMSFFELFLSEWTSFVIRNIGQLSQVFLGFVATLIATLIGVQKGFQKDREAKRQDDRKQMSNLLRSIQEEIQSNKSIANRNFRLLRRMQAQEDLDVDHYSVDLFSADVWEPALDAGAVSWLDSELFSDIQEVYILMRNTNELIRRLRSESLHQEIGESEQYGPIEFDVWTISVAYWDEDTSQIEELGLGELIKNNSKEIKLSISQLEDDLEEEVDRIGNDK
jgi:hypothetical protein